MVLVLYFCMISSLGEIELLQLGQAFEVSVSLSSKELFPDYDVYSYSVLYAGGMRLPGHVSICRHSFAHDFAEAIEVLRDDLSTTIRRPVLMSMHPKFDFAEGRLLGTPCLRHRLDKGIPFEGKVLIPKHYRHDASFMIEFVIDAESCDRSDSSVLLMLHQQKLRVGFASSMDVYRVRVQAKNRLDK